MNKMTDYQVQIMLNKLEWFVEESRSLSYLILVCPRQTGVAC